MNSRISFYVFSGSFMFFILVFAKSICSWNLCDFRFILWKILAIVPKMFAFIRAPIISSKMPVMIKTSLVGFISFPQSCNMAL